MDHPSRPDFKYTRISWGNIKARLSHEEELAMNQDFVPAKTQRSNARTSSMCMAGRVRLQSAACKQKLTKGPIYEYWTKFVYW